jgi:UDP-GlcNAc:undecaprenyl-phosphate GlcNAc-1-phosphate transferase
VKLLPVFLASCAAAVAITPAAIWGARRIGLLDHPRGYKAHTEPTPYLGGGVILTGFLAGALIYGAVDDSMLTAIFVGAAVMWLVGTLDDRFLLGPRVRVLAEVAVGVLLWDAGLGWSLFPGEIADLAVTVLWVVGIVNAFNLMDNVDGAAGTVGGVCAAGIALLAAQEGPEVLAALAVALCGACAGFLCSNLTRPARIFLGDGGSMLLGFLVAALVMAVWRLDDMIGPAFFPAIMLVGLPILDMTLVIVSRSRRGAEVGKGHRDHVTHRLLPKLGSTWALAATLAVCQGALSIAAIELMGAERGTILAAAAVAFVLGLVTIAILEAPYFHPGASGDRPPRRGELAQDSGQRREPIHSSRSRPGERWEVMSTSAPRNDGATSGRSHPGTELGP